MGLVYTDYKQLTSTAGYVAYIVGIALGKEFVSVSTLFYVTTDTLVQFNDDGLDILIKAGMPIEFDRKLYKVNVKHNGVAGTVDMWFEGSLAR